MGLLADLRLISNFYERLTLQTPVKSVTFFISHKLSRLELNQILTIMGFELFYLS
jgi:hypothetical protein